MKELFKKIMKVLAPIIFVFTAIVRTIFGIVGMGLFLIACGASDLEDALEEVSNKKRYLDF